MNNSKYSVKFELVPQISLKITPTFHLGYLGIVQGDGTHTDVHWVL